MNELMKPLELDGVETTELIVRFVNGEAVLFTDDGKLIRGQVPHFAHFWYTDEVPNRVGSLRTTIRLDCMTDETPRGRRPKADSSR